MKLTVENIVLTMVNVNSKTKIIVQELNGTAHEFEGYKDVLSSFDEVLQKEVLRIFVGSDNTIEFTVNDI